MNEPLLALVGKTQVGFFKKKTYLLIFAEHQTVLIPGDDSQGNDNLLAKALRKAPGTCPEENISARSRKEDMDDHLPAETVFLDNNEVCQVTLTATSSRGNSFEIRYLLEIASDKGTYEFELESTGNQGMFNLNTVLGRLFGKRFTVPEA